MRSLMLAALLIPFAAHAQSAPPPRPMPGYDDSGDRYGGYQDSYGTPDMHHDVDQTPPPPPVPEGYGAYDSPQGDEDGDMQDPRGYPPPAPSYRDRDYDAAHRADHARTYDLNRGPRAGYNAPLPPPGADGYASESARYRDQLADHAQAMQDYRDQQARYADRIARWRARADACERGDQRACDGPR